MVRKAAPNPSRSLTLPARREPAVLSFEPQVAKTALGKTAVEIAGTATVLHDPVAPNTISTVVAEGDWRLAADGPAQNRNLSRLGLSAEIADGEASPRGGQTS
jgi:hypothetical protein